MAERWEPTEQEARIAVRLMLVASFGSVLTIAIYNLTGLWWPGAAFVITLAATLVGVIAWAARTRGQTFAVTAWSIVRAPSPKRR